MPDKTDVFVSRFVSAADGLKLHYRDYGSRLDDGVTIVCLPGLTRTTEDFATIAPRLRHVGGKTHRILTLDYRGRGLSDRDPDWRRYNLGVESDDIMSVLIAAAVDRAIFIGTSRGGLHAMALAATRPTRLHAVILNDIGPAIEPLGLMRIKGYVGKMPTPKNWAQAVDILQATQGKQFTQLSPKDWLAYAQTCFIERHGEFSGRFDPALAKTLTDIGPDMPTIDLWPQFLGLSHCPIQVIRGANSDILSPETFAAMQSRHPQCEGFTVEGQGHAPLLMDDPTIDRIANFIARL